LSLLKIIGWKGFRRWTLLNGTIITTAKGGISDDVTVCMRASVKSLADSNHQSGWLQSFSPSLTAAVTNDSVAVHQAFSFGRLAQVT
jgi:hypothetical protein